MIPVLTADEATPYASEIQMWYETSRRTIKLEGAVQRARMPVGLVDELTSPLDLRYGWVDRATRRVELRDDHGKRFVYRIDGQDAATGDLFIAWPD